MIGRRNRFVSTPAPINDKEYCDFYTDGSVVYDYMVIPRECSLAPIEVRLCRDPSKRSDQDSVNVKFLWNINGRNQQLDILSQTLCSDCGVPYDRSVIDDIKRQIDDALIIENDFAVLVEWLSTDNKTTIKIHQELVKPVIICLNLPEQNLRLNECISWNLLNSDWEVTELINNITHDHNLTHLHNVDMTYQFKKQLLAYKRSVLTQYSSLLYSYTSQNGLRVPYVCRNENEVYNDNKPIMKLNSDNIPPDLLNDHKSSHKERLNYIRKLRNRSL